MVRDGLIYKMTFVQRLERGENTSLGSLEKCPGPRRKWVGSFEVRVLVPFVLGREAAMA